MIIAEARCQICGHRFEVELLDRDDPAERCIAGGQLCCPRPNCRSREVEIVRKIRREKRRAG
jgi:hypothetical protein